MGLRAVLCAVYCKTSPYSRLKLPYIVTTSGRDSQLGSAQVLHPFCYSRAILIADPRDGIPLPCPSTFARTFRSH